MRFRPKIKKLIEEYELDNKLYIPKNSGLKDITTQTLAMLGIEPETETEIEIIPTNGQTIPEIIDKEYKNLTKAMGLTGDNLYDEYIIKNPYSKTSILETFEWYDEEAIFRRPTLCLMKPKGKNLEGEVRVAVPFKYEMTSRKFMEEFDPVFDFNIDVYKGDTEIIASQGLADACIDIIYSGRTLNKYNLEIVDRIRSSDFVIIAVDESNPKAFLLDYQQIWDSIKNPRPGSYTQKISQDMNSIVKKFGEESGECIQAMVLGEGIAEELPQVIYCGMIGAIKEGVEFKDITRNIFKALK